MGKTLPLITKAEYSNNLATPLQLDFLSNHADNTAGNLTLYSDAASTCLIKDLTDLKPNSPLAPVFLTFLSTALYRYTYQSEFELPYIKDSGTPDDTNSPLGLVRINFQNHTQQTALACFHSISNILDSDIKFNMTPSVSPICLLELENTDDFNIKSLALKFSSYSPKIWPIISKNKKSYSLSWLYDESISVEIIIKLQAHIQQIVNSFQAQPNLLLSNYNLLTEKEVEQQLTFSKGPSYTIKTTPLYKHIEQHAKFTPNKVAVTHINNKLTYEQLNTQANKLAHSLLSKNITHGSVVAVHVLPSVNIIVAILALHKIGAIYVPIDPRFPALRIEAILNEINPLIILCDEEPEPSQVGKKYFSLYHTIDSLIKSSSCDDNPNITVTADDVSHIYFTSGTTGKPKGVISTHGNLIHYVTSAINRYRFNNDDIFIAAARFTFSISMFKLLVPMVTGGTVNILPRESVLDLNKLSEEIAAATVFHFGPSLLRQLLPYIENNYTSFEKFKNLKHVSSGGDMVPPEILEKLKNIFTNAEVFVIYGSSEISCMGCTYEVPRDQTITKTFVGRPHQNVKMRIFDYNMNMVPLGVAGQVYFAGPGLVKGYLNLPELTEEKFTLIGGKRFYSIGDIGRLDKNGNLALLGREDFQVQIRGMRIELLEVEACLKNYPAILDCVAVAKTLQNNDEKSLIAYLIIKKNKKILISDLNSYLSKHLPEYMIPSIFIKLDKLPTNHNNKLDRSQLPAPNSKNILVSADFQPATNDVEKKLITIWEKLFKISNIGIDHNFFELGGDSLLAVNFLIEIDNEFTKFIPISIMIDTPTIRGIAQIVSSKNTIKNIGDIVVLKKGNSEPPLFCLYGVLLYKDLAATFNSNRMVCGVYLQNEISLIKKGPDSTEFKSFSNIDNISKQYLTSIQSFQPHGPYYLCGESFGGIIALEVARKLLKQGESVKLIAMFDTSSPGYQKGLSVLNRIAIHIRLTRELGLSYLIQKLSKLVFFNNQKVGTRNDSTNPTADIRAQARAHAMKGYQPEKFDSNVLLFTAKERPAFDSGKQDLGWKRFISSLEIHEINGSHLAILECGQVEKLSEILLKNTR